MLLLKSEKNVLGEDHPDTASSYGHIGNLYGRKGDYKNAIKFCEREIAANEKVLGKDHLDTAYSYYNFATVCENHGQMKVAMDYLSRCLKIRESKLPVDHPDIRNTTELLCKWKQQL